MSKTSIKQPSYQSRSGNDRIPSLTGPRHAVQDGQQLSHARGESYLLRFTGRQESLVELTQDRVAATGHQRSHIRCRSNCGSTSPYPALPPMGPAVSAEGRHPNQSRDLLAVQRAQFRQERKQRQRYLRSHSGYTAQQVILLPPQRTPMYPVAQVGVQVVEFLQ